jgi:hypothetical protein
MAKEHIFEAIYDGPIDARGFDFQAVILEKLPDLKDGDAWLEPVNVHQGDWVVNDAGVLVRLIQVKWYVLMDAINQIARFRGRVISCRWRKSLLNLLYERILNGLMECL